MELDATGVLKQWFDAKGRVYWHSVIEIMKWINIYIHGFKGFMWDVIIHPYLNFNGGLTKPPLELVLGEISYPCPNPDVDLANLC